MAVFNVFNTDASIPAQPIFILLAWAASLGVSFHALNGGALFCMNYSEGETMSP